MKRQRGFVVMSGRKSGPATSGHVSHRWLRLLVAVLPSRSTLQHLRTFLTGLLIGAGIWAFFFATMTS